MSLKTFVTMGKTCPHLLDTAADREAYILKIDHKSPLYHQTEKNPSRILSLIPMPAKKGSRQPPCAKIK
jgi:hypothetical protein